MTWKERKALENKKIVSLGGKVNFLLCFFIGSKLYNLHI